jgi:hypothetical protein
MGSVFKKTVTRPLPKGAGLFMKNGQQFARWNPARGGKTRTAKVTTGGGRLASNPRRSGNLYRQVSGRLGIRLRSLNRLP